MNNLVVLILFSAIMAAFYWYQDKKNKAFEAAYLEYTQDLVGMVMPSKELFRWIQAHTKNPVTVLGRPIRFFGPDTNHRDGDELIKSPDRDPVKRIHDHLNLKEIKNTKLISLGYSFKNKDNLMQFTSLLLEETVSMKPNSSIILPINNELCIFGRTATNQKMVAIPFKVFKELEGVTGN